ncbi:MAG: 2,6-beta-D-fructofuranosidase [Kiritimatiellae bacterium]|nr:2,6-beta-D-fructofuranosidase [Kiritimatiellia bacterium]
MKKLICALWVAAAGIASAEDILFADFEGSDYGKGWTVEGAAFGKGPARGTLPGQMEVSGFVGKGLVNSFYGGDAPKGTLTSPAFTIRKPFINFLIGGGGYPDETCMKLVIGGKAVRAVQGPNVAPGGSEALSPASWDVREFIGKEAVIRIIDNRSEGWGHINVDQIVFSDKAVAQKHDQERKIAIDQPYLLFPVKNGAPRYRVTVFDGETELHYMDVQLAPGDPDWYGTLDIAPFKGKTLTLKVSRYPEDETGFTGIKTASAPYTTPQDYRESKRAQFHFQPRYGWNNDPNGLSYFNGEWHLFFQHNPYGVEWGNMHWGHAVSKDLVHWKEVTVALHPDKLGTMFSGSAAVDHQNTAGFGAGAHILIYTATAGGSTQCIAHSLDGRHYTKWEGNPVVANVTGGNRDPKISWHAPSKRWVLVFYIEDKGYHTIGVYNSPDLKAWTRVGTIVGDKTNEGNFLFECPDLFELPVEGSQESRWVVFGASGAYAIGRFDGKTFTPEADHIPLSFGSGAYYAAQTFSDAPDGRRILLPWMHLAAPGMNFNQGMGIPRVLGLKRTREGIRMTQTPIRELESLRDGEAVPFGKFDGELLEAIVDCAVLPNARVTFTLRGVPIAYDGLSGTLSVHGRTVAWPLVNGRLAFTAYLDRVGLEIFSADGLGCLAFSDIIPDPANRTISVDGANRLRDNKNRAYALKSAWESR